MTIDPAAGLTAYDEQLRDVAEMTHARSFDRFGPLLRGIMPNSGFVSYRDLAGLRGRELDDLIAATVAYYRDETDVARFEWKTRGHDEPADLPVRLLAHGFVPEDVETVMVGSAEAFARDVAVPAGVVVRRVGEHGDLLGDVEAAGAMQAEVFGHGVGEAAEMAERIASSSGLIEMWLAEADGQVVCAGRVDIVANTEFAGLWGGATVPAWRGRGIYRAVVAARARTALARGARYLHSDCTDMSRPILQRSGLVAVTTTRPYIWTRPAQ